MKTKQMLTVIVLLISTQIMAQKAYDSELYVTKFNGTKINFVYANGYAEASKIEMRQKEINQDRTADYRVKNGIFTQKYNVKGGYILVYLNSSDVNNGEDIQQIKADYFYNGDKYPLVFYKYVQDISYKEADKELNKVYRQILKKYQKAPKFLAKLKQAQRLWIKFRDAKLEMHYPMEDKRLAYGTMYDGCAEQFLTTMTVERTDVLKEWLKKGAEYEGCNGSKGVYEESIYSY